MARGGGKHTPKRRNTVFTEGLEFASPAKKQKLNFGNLQKFWAKLEVETPKSSSLSKIGHNEGKLVLPISRATTKVSHRLSENESCDKDSE